VTSLREVLGVIRTTHHEADPCARILKAWAYGEAEECETCRGWGRVETDPPQVDEADECPACHGTGEVRGPGLVERVGKAAWEAREMVPDGPDPRATAWVAALREELGTP